MNKSLSKTNLTIAKAINMQVGGGGRELPETVGCKGKGLGGKQIAETALVQSCIKARSYSKKNRGRRGG